MVGLDDPACLFQLKQLYDSMKITVIFLLVASVGNFANYTLHLHALATILKFQLKKNLKLL